MLITVKWTPVNPEGGTRKSSRWSMQIKLYSDLYFRLLWKREGVGYFLSFNVSPNLRTNHAFNPFTAPACKISGLKSAHMHATEQYIW